MKFHKILISLIFIMFLVGISCVSAENIDELGTSSSDDVISTDGDVSNTIDNVESDVSTSSVDDEVISDRGSTQEVNSWAGLQSKIEDSSVSIVKLNASNIAPSTSSSDQISINHDITVVGGDGYYIGSADWSSAPKYNYIPMITSGNNLNVRFENVTFQYLSDNILMKLMGNGNYVFKNCIFDHINATGDHQSVIWLNYGYALIDNCTFTNCNCSFGAVTNYYTSWGTAVNNARMTVKDSTFRDNICPGEPGAINNCGYLEVYDSIFEDNRAAWWAGAIHTHSRATTTIVRSSFKNNYAGWYGGALYTYSNLHVINSTFISNMAVSAGYVGGGAIGASNYQGSYPNVVVENSIFKYNTELNFRGGAIAVDGKGNLEVYNSTFVNNSAGNGYGNAISYYYTGSSSSAAYFTYTDNGFYGPNNGSGSIYIYNDKVNVVQSNNNIEDYSSYVEPEENNTNPEGSVVPIPSGTTIGSQLWNSSLSGDLGGTPLVNGERIYVPNGQAIYCLNITNGNLLWNVSSEWGYFHELALHNGVLIAPCAWDKLFMFDAMTGTEIQPTSNMYQASSYYAPAIDGNTIYVSSEHGYGANENLWIAVVEYVNGNYSYTGSILEISGVTNNSNALISAPILWNNYLWVNTINGLVRYDLTANTYITPVVNAVGKPVVGGDYIYVLTADNHICGVNANGNVIKNISVGGNVGSTLAINNANTVLYTVNAEGKIYCADISSSTADAINPQINPVSSALRVGSDGYLYIGDDAGILWVFNSYYSHGNLVSTVLWAYNVTSPIFGELIINNNVYVGTNDTFYDLSRNMAYSSNFDNILNIYNSKLMNDEILSINNQEGILSDTLSPGQLDANVFSKGDTTYYLNEGSYYIGSYGYIDLGVDSNLNPQNNIVIKPVDGAIVSIIFREQEEGFYIYKGENITIENIKFTTSNYHMGYGLFHIYDNAKNIFFKNCTFENCIDSHMAMSDTCSIFRLNKDGQLGTISSNVVIDNCKFTNCQMNKIIYVEYVNSVNITNCIFEKNTVKTSEIVSKANIYLKNNQFDNNNSISIEDNGKIVSDVSFNVLTESLTVGESGSIVGELVDDNGNRIKSDKLKLSIDGISETPTFDPNTGLYTSSKFTPTGNEVSVGAECRNIDPFNFETVYIPVKSTTDLIINCSDSGVYGTEFKVNATLNSTITGENITFTVFNSTNGLVKSVNTTITGGFASYSFADLPAGDYTVVADYAGGTSFVPVSDSKAFTITQADSSIEINVLNDIIHVGDKINVKAVVPTGATGNVTFRLENSKTVDVGEVAIFDGLSAGNYFIYAIYNGDANYRASKEVNVTINVVKYDLNLKLTADNITYGESLVVKISTNENFTGGINVYVGELKQAAQIINGIGNATFTNLPAADYFIKANFTENETFYSDSANTTASVNKMDVDLTISAESVSYGDPLVVVVNANVKFSGKVIVKIGTLNQTVNVVKGKGNATFNNLSAADYFITASFTGDEAFYADSANTTATVNGVEVPADKAISTNVPANTKSPNFSIKLDKDATGNFTVSIDNGKIVKTAELKDGAASITVADLPAGDHNISISYSGDGKYAPITQNTTLTIKEPVKPTPKVTKKATKIVAKKKTFKAKVKVKKYTITLKSGKTLLKKVKVTLKVKGKTYKATTNNKGKATFKIKNLKKKGTYKAVINFKGNKNYNPSSKKVKIKVKK